MSLRVSDGIGTGTPGTLTPLWLLTRPPARTRHSARPRLTRSTRSRTRPSSISTSWPGWRTSPITAGSTGSSPSRVPSLPTTTTSSPDVSAPGAGSSPIRSFGPCRSAISASGRPSLASASRTRRARSACSSRLPCERLSRAASMPASTSARTPSAVPVAGPMVATIFVLRGGCATIVPRLAPAFDSPVSPPLFFRRMPRAGLTLGARKRRPPWIRRPPGELLLDAEQLVVLRDAVAPRRRACLDLPGAVGNREIGDRRILGLAGPVRHDGGVTVRARERQRLGGLRDRPDLVDLDEDRVCCAAVDPVAESLDVRDEDVVADELDTVAELLRQLSPAVPVILGKRVLE